MKKIIFHNIAIFSAIIISFFACQSSLNPQDLSLMTLAPVMIKRNGAERFQYWEFKNQSYLWDTNFIPPLALKSFRDSLANELGQDTFNLISTMLAYQSASYPSVKTDNGDSINAQLIHSNTVGKIRPINFLEAQLLNYQLSRYPLLSHPTEFHGMILMHDTLNLIKVYFAASDQPWPPKPAVILEAMQKDLQQGWIFRSHLHNHYEPKAHHFLGILAPSMTDAQYYQFLAEEYKVEQALITNGYHTLEIRKDEFQKLVLPDDH